MRRRTGSSKATSTRALLRESWQEGDARERGVVLAFLALVLFTLIVMAGFTIDVANWWWTGQKLQKTADAAALGGVVYLPDDLDEAIIAADEISERNGYTNGTNATIEAETADRPTRLRVTVETEVDNFFASIIGLESTSITRTAVADYAGSVPMGSPASYLGNDPELGQTEPARLQQLWLNIAGRAATKISGDRYTAGRCTTGGESVFQCPGTLGPNSEYLMDKSSTTNEGYRFSVVVDALQAGRPLDIQIYDPAFIFTGDTCGSNLPSDAENATLQSTYSNHATFGTFYNDAVTRYENSGNTFCTGDQSITSADMNTAYIVRRPDDTPWNDLDNDVIDTATCQPTNYRPINAAVYPYLNPNPTATTYASHYNTTTGSYVRNNFHRWVTVCSIPAGSVEVGEYILQIRTNHQVGTEETFSSAVNTGGHNRFSIRAGFPVSAGGVPNGSGIKVHATGKLPIYVNAGTDSTPNFYLARITPTAANRTLRLEFYDIGDVGGTNASVNLQVVPPPDANVGSTFSDCTFQRDNSTAVTSSNCTFTGMTSGNYNGRMVSLSIPIPGNYDCDFGDDGGCWIRVRLSFNNATPTDTTTWSASIDGDPVRLIE